MFDLSRKETFKNIKEWIKIFKEGLKSEEDDIIFILVGNKADLHDEREIDFDTAINMGKNLNCLKYLETSGKTGINVKQLFDDLVYALIKNVCIQ